jgi:Protein of unknown function (DUF2490)
MVCHRPAILGNALSRSKRTMMAWYSPCCVILAGCMSMLHCVALGQTTSTETKWIEEADAHIQLPSQWRVLALVGGQQGQNYPYHQWYAGAGLGYQFKPFSMPHPQNIDPDKNFYLVVGVGYEHLDTGSSGKSENRIILDATPGYNFPGDLLLRDRNYFEFRWINGKYSTTYRNRLTLEHEFNIGALHFSPYGSVEAFYDTDSHSAEGSYNSRGHTWNQWWYSAGVQLPYQRWFKLEVYYRRENCSTCTPASWNAGGISVNFFLDAQSVH